MCKIIPHAPLNLHPLLNKIPLLDESYRVKCSTKFLRRLVDKEAFSSIAKLLNSFEQESHYHTTFSQNEESAISHPRCSEKIHLLNDHRFPLDASYPMSDRQGKEHDYL